MKKILKFVFLMVVALVAISGGTYYRYVTNTESPYDEIGIELNIRMPGPIRAWGCAQLKTNFANQIPPLGCSAEDDASTWAS